MQTDKIKMTTQNILKEYNISIYSIEDTKIGNQKVLQILLDVENITYELLETIHLKVLDEIDEYLPDDYYLELSSVGIERPLDSLSEVSDNIGKYVYIESDEYTGNATIKDISDSIITITYFLKGQPKMKQINYDAIKFIRKAIKI